MNSKDFLCRIRADIALCWRPTKLDIGEFYTYRADVFILALNTYKKCIIVLRFDGDGFYHSFQAYFGGETLSVG